MPASDFSIDIAQIVALFMESVFYGVYLITFASCMRSILWSDASGRWRSINYKMLFASVLMFVLGTMDLAFGLRHILDAFIYFKGSASVELSNTRYWVNVMKMGIYVSQTFVGDTILIYRCWIIYQKNWLVVVAPAVLLVSETVCGAFTTYVEACYRTNALLNQAKLKPFITSMLSLTLANNVLTTSLIVFRLCRVQLALKHWGVSYSNQHLSRVTRVMLESGLIYTFSVLILFGTYLASNNAQLAVSDSIVQIIGITFNLLITGSDQKTPGPQTDPLPLHCIHVQAHVHSKASNFGQDPEEPSPSTKLGE